SLPPPARCAAQTLALRIRHRAARSASRHGKSHKGRGESRVEVTRGPFTLTVISSRRMSDYSTRATMPHSEAPWLATYRLQIHKDFPLDAAADILPYLRDLGISHVYLSPCLQAAPGSLHGYDVADPTRINDE